MKTNVHIFRNEWQPKKVLLLSDIHWDNPKCDRDLLKRHLDQAKEIGADVLLNGDTFCCMMGKYDPRRTKDGIRPEHNKNNYLDVVVNDAIDWFSPYAHLIKVVGYGNHETAILKNLESDLIERFVFGLNSTNGTNVEVGGYGGWIVYGFQRDNGQGRTRFNIKYFHGSGGSAYASKGSLNFHRMSTFIEGADLIWMGHVHEDMEITYSAERLSSNNKVHLKDILMVRTATYKEEYNEGKGGWHVERGASPKPLGGRWLELHPERTWKDNKEIMKVNAFTYKTL